MWRMRQIRQGYCVECATDDTVDLLPCIADRTAVFKLTLTVDHAAFSDAQWPLKHIDDFCCADALWCTGEGIAAPSTAQRVHEVAAGQNLEQFLYGRQCNTRADRDIVRRTHGACLRGEMHENHRAVVGQFADADHMGLS